jgi:predicted RNase H-like HicB family nuclease
MAYRILAHWDAEASVWWAESTDVKGLVAEAGTLEELVADLREIARKATATFRCLPKSRAGTQQTRS